jgi:hypothetical protein
LVLSVVGGASRAGKTLLARRLSAERGLPFVSLDSLMMGLARGAPTLGIDPSAPTDEIAGRMWPVVGAFCQNVIDSGMEYAVEGHAVLPGDVLRLALANPRQVKACFLGFADVDPEDNSA